MSSARARLPFFLCISKLVIVIRSISHNANRTTFELVIAAILDVFSAQTFHGFKRIGIRLLSRKTVLNVRKSVFKVILF